MNEEIKVVLLGDSGVGKSSIMERYVSNTFEPGAPATISASFASKRVELKKSKQAATLNIWDTAGQEKYRSLAKHYFQGASIALVVYDITKKDTFEGAKRWIADIKQRYNRDVTILLVANKVDLIELEEVQMSEVQAYAEEQDMRLFLTSAKAGIGIDKLFSSAVKYALQSQSVEIPTDDVKP